MNPTLIGKFNKLEISHFTEHGAYLTADGSETILLPGKWIPPGAGTGDVLDVFIYRDSEDRLVCTTQRPLAQVGECAFLEAVGFKQGVGVFLNWGLEKDLLLPLREQIRPVGAGEHVVVFIHIDDRSERIVATMRLNRHLHTTAPRFAVGQSVPLLVSEETPLGYRCIVAHSHFGMVYHSDLGCELRIGTACEGFIREVRPDGKIDLRLDRPGYRRVAPLAEKICEALEKSGGRLPLHDKSGPEEIRAAFGCSKKAFKQAIGSLFRNRLVVITPEGIERAQ